MSHLSSSAIAGDDDVSSRPKTEEDGGPPPSKKFKQQIENVFSTERDASDAGRDINSEEENEFSLGETLRVSYILILYTSHLRRLHP